MTELPDVVYVVDDDPSVRKALERLFRSIGYECISFSSATEFLAGKRRDAPACLVLDVRLPGLSGLDLQRQMAEANMLIPIVFLTGHGDVPLSVRAMKAGAVDFLTKPFHEQDLLDAVRSALDRNRASKLHESETSTLHQRYETLTPREREVFVLIVTGRLNKQAAAELGTSERTIKAHRHQVMEKMGAESPAELGAMAERLGLTTSKG
ncbi:MAG TPA: response regulator [Blastocatellia bacterium]|nr:response regulator [Blastocatellia bacterium]